MHMGAIERGWLDESHGRVFDAYQTGRADGTFDYMAKRIAESLVRGPG